MSWDRLPRIYQEIADAVCTPRELEALRLSYGGMSQRRIALALGIRRSSVRDRLANAHEKIAQHPNFPQETEYA